MYVEMHNESSEDITLGKLYFKSYLNSIKEECIFYVSVYSLIKL